MLLSSLKRAIFEMEISFYIWQEKFEAAWPARQAFLFENSRFSLFSFV